MTTITSPLREDPPPPRIRTTTSTTDRPPIHRSSPIGGSCIRFAVFWGVWERQYKIQLDTTITHHYESVCSVCSVHPLAEPSTNANQCPCVSPSLDYPYLLQNAFSDCCLSAWLRPHGQCGLHLEQCPGDSSSQQWR